MKNITFAITFITSIVFSIRGICQDTAYYFNKLYACSPCSMLSVAGLPYGEDYLIYGGFNGPNDYSAFYLRTINAKGEEKAFAIIDDGLLTSVVLGNTLVWTTDGNLASVGRKGESEENQYLTAYKFTVDGILLWSKHYQHSGYIDGNSQVVALPDGGLLLAGWTYEWATEKSWFYTIRTDSQGQELWRKKYAQGSSNTLLHAAATPDGGFVLSGYTKLTSTTPSDRFVVKTDSLGEVQWQRTYGTPQQTDGGFLVQPYGNIYIAAGAWQNNDNYLVYLNEMGEIVRDTVLNSTMGFGAVSCPPIVLPNGNIAALVIAAQSNTVNDYFTVFTIYDSAFNIIVEEAIPEAIAGFIDNIIRDLEPTPDGGFLLTGFTYAPENSWVLKVDSLGQTCSYIGCDSVVVAQPTAVVEALPPAQMPHTLTAYPNPTAQKVQIQYAQPLPQASQWAIYDYLGNRLWATQAHTNPTTLNTETLPNGIYLCQLEANGRAVATTKFIVSH